MRHSVARGAGGLAMVVAALVWTIVASAEQGGGAVTIQVAVERPDGTPMPGLAREDFAVSDDRGPCVVGAVSSHEVPLTIICLIDVTRSAETLKADIRDAVEDHLARNLTLRDRMRIGTVATPMWLAPGYTVDRSRALDQVRRAFSLPEAARSGPSPVWDAIDTAIGELEGETGRRAVLVFTDARATGNAKSRAEVVGHAITAGVSINGLGPADNELIQQTATTAVRVRPSVIFQQSALETGGVALFFSRSFNIRDFGMIPANTFGKDLAVRTTKLMERLHGMYSLNLSCGAADGRPHALTVKVARPGVFVRAPRGYVARPLSPVLHDSSTTSR